MSVDRRCWILLAALGCTRTLQLDEAGDASEAASSLPEDGDSEGDTADASDSADPAGTADRPDTADSAEPADTADTAAPQDTAAPVPTACLPADTTGFRIPSTRWALSVLFASRRLAEPDGNVLVLSPQWFLASAWQSGSFACGGYGTPWSDEADPTEGGCYALQPGTHWAEIVRLFPDRFTHEGWPSWVDGDSPERSSLALAQAVYAGQLLLRRVDGVDPDTRLAAAADPLAVERLAMIFHVEGPWSSTASEVWESCEDDLSRCADETLAHHIGGVEAKLATFAETDCYDAPIPDDELDAFVSALAPLWPEADWAAISTAVHAQNNQVGFASEGLAIVEAVESGIDAPLACPEEPLWDYYRYSCF